MSWFSKAGDALKNGFDKLFQTDYEKKQRKLKEERDLLDLDIQKQNQLQSAEAFEWQKNAYQNTAFDMSKAGINPAALGNGVPANSVGAQQVGVQGFTSEASSSFDRANNLASGVFDKIIQGRQMKEQQRVNDVQIDNVNADTNKKQQEVLDMINEDIRRTSADIRAENDEKRKAELSEYEKTQREKKEKLLQQQIELLVAQKRNQDASTRRQNSSSDYWDALGLDPSSSNEVKTVVEGAHAAAKQVNDVVEAVNDPTRRGSRAERKGRKEAERRQDEWRKSKTMSDSEYETYIRGEGKELYETYMNLYRNLPPKKRAERVKYKITHANDAR